MDIKQDEIPTLHELCIDEKKLMKTVSDASAERPVSVIMPMLYREIKNDALENIVKGLNKCDYLYEIVIPLAAKNEKEFRQVKRFFSELKIPKLIVWCNGPKVEKLLTELKAAHDKKDKNAGIDIFTGKVVDVWKLGVIEPLKIKTQAIKSASEAAEMILRIDDIIAAGRLSKDVGPPAGMPGMGAMPPY